jgi:hypothetical protein
MYFRCVSQLFSVLLKSTEASTESTEVTVSRPNVGGIIAQAFLIAIAVVITVDSANAQYGNCSGEEISALVRSGANNIQICQYCDMPNCGGSFVEPRPGGGRFGPYATQRRAYEVADEMASRGMDCYVQAVSDEYYVMC